MSFIKIPGVNPPTSRPRIDIIDALLPDQGALLLVDPGHSIQPWAAGVPANAAKVPNLAADQAMALTGATTANLEPIMDYTGFAGISTRLLERSSKGGFHAANSGASWSTSQGLALRYPQAILNYIAANPTHDYYASLWMYLTEGESSTPGWQAIGLSASADASSGYTHVISNASTNYPSNANRVGYRRSKILRTVDAGYTGPGPFIGTIGVSQYSGAPDQAATTGYLNSQVFKVGNRGLYPSTNPSGAMLYRAYLEDLTVSGRNYIDLDALDFAKYTADVLTSGGRYYGDTYTDPTTLV